MRKILNVFIAMLTMVASSICAQRTTNIAINDERSAKYTIEAGLAEQDVSNIQFDILVNYDMESRELTLVMTPQFDNYNMVWLPLSAYGYTKLNREVRQQLHGKFKQSKLFKIQFETGTKPLFDCQNCISDESVSSTLKHDIWKTGENVVYHFKVTNPRQHIYINLQNFIPITTRNSRFGKTKYVFQYISDPIQLDITVPSNPCSLTKNKSLLSDANKLFAEADSLFEKLANYRGLKDEKRFTETKNAIKGIINQRYQQIKATNDSQNLKCIDVQNLLNECKDIIEKTDAINVQISTSSFGVAAPDVATDFNKAAESLRMYTDAIRSGNNVVASKRSGEELIAEMESKLKALSDKTRSSKKNDQAIKTYLIVKKGFEKFSNK